MQLSVEKIGIFGAGHLARALASRFVRVGFTDDNLSLCHRDSSATGHALEEAGLVHLVRKPAEVSGRSNILLYAVRPQDYKAVAAYTLPREALSVSFLAGVPVDRIPVCVPGHRLPASGYRNPRRLLPAGVIRAGMGTLRCKVAHQRILGQFGEVRFHDPKHVFRQLAIHPPKFTPPIK